MGMFGMYGPADERESIATIPAALDAGITLLDTGDYLRKTRRGLGTGPRTRSGSDARGNSRNG
jgi:aryl-alcohol dehydrogenase-like predicted oxidoreductase